MRLQIQWAGGRPHDQQQPACHEAVCLGRVLGQAACVAHRSKQPPGLEHLPWISHSPPGAHGLCPQELNSHQRGSLGKGSKLP